MTDNRNHINSISAAFWNANGLKPSHLELVEFTHRYELDVVMISETHLSGQDKDPKIKGYRTYRTDRDGRGGGTAIFVRSFLPHYSIPSPTTSVETTGVCIQTRHGLLTLFSCYNAPQTMLNGNDLQGLVNAGISVITAGDFNAKHLNWHSRTTNRNGRILSQFAEDHNINIVAPLEPTHYNYVTGLPETLDIAIVNNVPLQVTLSAVDELSSDHKPVLMHIGQGPNTTAPKTLKRTDWKQFCACLDSNFGPLPLITTVSQIETAIQNFEEKVESAKNASTRTIPLRRNRDPLPLHIRDLIRERNRARRRAQRSLHPLDKREANRLTNEVRLALTDLRNERWQSRVEELSVEDNSVWRMTKALRNDKKPLPPIHSERGLVFTDPEKAEAFADSLEQQCTPNWRNANLDHVRRVEHSLRRSLSAPVLEPLTPVSPTEVKTLISRLRTRKAPGPDGISNTALKNLPQKAIMALVGIFNAMFRMTYFPKRWKNATVIYIPKPGKDPQFPQNHRPISLLSAAGKIAEKLILARLQETVTRLNILPDEQFGFRAKHSTVDQLLRVTEYVSQGFNWRQHTGAVFLDVSKAFDTVWHEGVIYKLLVTRIPLALVKIIKSFLTQRSFCARINGSLSTERQLMAGVPQGAVLSPTLYALFTADLPRAAGCDLAVYADDTACLTRSLSSRVATERLQNAVDELEEWMKLWRVDVNPEKSQAILFTRRRVNPHGEITMFGRAIPWAKEVKYLGIKFDSRLNFNVHIAYAVQKAAMVNSALYSLTCRKSKLSTKNKLLLYKTIIRPTMLYGSIAWGHVSMSKILKLQVIQNKFLRSAFDAPWFVRNSQLHKDAGILTIKEYLSENAAKSFVIAENHPNPLIRKAVDYDENEPSRVKRPRMQLLL